MRLLVIADVGGNETRHIGDEAMLEANLAALRERIPNVAFTIVSRDPAWAAARYGVEAVAPFGFSRTSAGERRVLLQRVLTTSNDVMASADALLISGGGNLSSTWPDLLYERAALLLLARRYGKPAVVVGQTIGPRLARDERRLLSNALSSARLVGVRERPSYALALMLGVPRERLRYQTDDALFLGPPPQTRTNTIAVTIDPQIRAAGEVVYGSLVRQLRALAQMTGAAITLIPHAWGDESGPSDLTEARLLAEQLPGATIAEGLDARDAARLTGEASLVVSSRYHPIVFALAAGVPAIGIHGDAYCRIKLEGALAHASLERWTITYRELTRDALLAKAIALWHQRDDVRRALESHRQRWRDEERARWDAVLRALDPNVPVATAPQSYWRTKLRSLSAHFSQRLP